METLLNESVSLDSYQITGTTPFNLAKIDFEELQERFFNKENQRTLLESLKSSLGKRLSSMLEANKHRKSYLERFENLIADYNSGNIDLEKIFLELVKFSRDLDAEEHRHIKENLT